MVRSLRFLQAIALVGVAASFLFCSSDPPAASSGNLPPFTSDGGGGTDSGDDGSPLVGDGGPCSPTTPPRCEPANAWGMGTTLSVSTPSADELLASITPDELHLAWVSQLSPSGEDASPGEEAIVSVADRAAPEAPFSAPITLPATTGYFALERLALSPDGLKLVVVRGDRHAFALYTRPSVGAPFTGPDEAALAVVNERTTDIPEAILADPLFSPDGQDLSYYLEIPQGASFRRANKVFAPSDPGFSDNALTEAELQSAGKRLRLSGVSGDERTLFFYDESTRKQRAAHRGGKECPFVQFVDVGNQVWAAPNGDCTKLYYSALVGTSIDLLSAPRNDNK